MPRCGRLRTFIREYRESPRLEKASFIPPFLILTLEVILIIHAFIVNEIYVILVTFILLGISLVEIIFVAVEMHKHYARINFDRVLTIKLDDFITKKDEKNVKKIVSDFIEENPEYEANRNEIYHTTCQILETHKEESIEKDLTDKLTKFIKKKKKATVDEIVKLFIERFPQYKNYRSEVYEKTCQIKVDTIEK